MFAVHRTRLRLLQVVASGGRFPTSVAIRHSPIYVLNAGDEGSISGFRRNANDRLTAIPGSVRSLDLGGTTPPSFRSSPAQVGLTDDGAHCWSARRTTAPWTRLRSDPTAGPPPLR